MHHLSPALPFFVPQLIFTPLPSYLLPLAPSNVLISPHPLLSPSRVFILFCGELCYDKDFTPRMYAVSACVMPLWGMGALTSSASTTRPALPRQKGLGGGAGGGWLLPTPCPAWRWWKLHTHTYTHTDREQLDSLDKIFFFSFFFLFCSHGQSKMLTWDFLAKSIFLSR